MQNSAVRRLLGHLFCCGLLVLSCMVQAHAQVQEQAKVNVSGAKPLEKVVVNVGWMAQAPLGGFYQALADGTYARHGLDVQLLQSDPQTNGHTQMMQGSIDFLIVSDLMEVFESAQSGSPSVVVGAMFQKDPRMVMAHPEHGYRHLQELAQAPALYIGKIGLSTYWKWMKATHGFVDEMVLPEEDQNPAQQEWTTGTIDVPQRYAYNLRPFMANKRALQLGYVVDEPIVVRAVGGFDPTVFMLADYGFNGYSTLVQVQRKLLQSKPEVVRKFMQASVEGWYRYLYGDFAPAHALIKKENPVMSDAYMELSRTLLKSFDLVESGDGATLGIGAMRMERVRSFYELMVKVGLYQQSQLRLEELFSLDFVNQKHGMALKENSPRP